jgi:hypothetical protein
MKKKVSVKFLHGKNISLDTELWRYMSLGAFFLLLQQNKVFVPTLRKLQEGDPKEMRIRQHSLAAMGDCLVGSEAFKKAREWLKIKHRSRTGFDLDRWCSNANMQNPLLMDEWIEQLSVRRCAWCWFSPSKPPPNWVESMAMWNLYARNGVAIKTTLKQLIAALRTQALSEVLVAEVEYRIQGVPSSLFNNQEYTKRPFLMKSASYGYENEVRLVFQANAAAMASGLKVSVDAKTLLGRAEVIVSPFVVPDEAGALVEVVRGLLPGIAVTFRASSERDPKPNDPTHGLGWKDDLASCYKPFSTEPDLPELLREL